MFKITGGNSMTRGYEYHSRGIMCWPTGSIGGIRTAWLVDGIRTGRRYTNCSVGWRSHVLDKHGRKTVCLWRVWPVVLPKREYNKAWTGNRREKTVPTRKWRISKVSDFLLQCASDCASSDYRFENQSSHSSQAYGFSPVCDLTELRQTIQMGERLLAHTRPPAIPRSALCTLFAATNLVTSIRPGYDAKELTMINYKKKIRSKIM